MDALLQAAPWSWRVWQINGTQADEAHQCVQDSSLSRLVLIHYTSLQMRARTLLKNANHTSKSSSATPVSSALRPRFSMLTSVPSPIHARHT